MNENFQIWTYDYEWYDSKIEDVVRSGNQISIIETYDFDDQYENKEITLTFDEEGKLTAMTKGYLPTRNCAEKDKVIDAEMVVHVTRVGEIADTINHQDLSTPMSFSYQQDIADNPDAKVSGFVNTDSRRVRNMEDALNLAANECTLRPQESLDGEGYNMTRVFYDESAQIWKVEFMYSVDDRVYQAVYLNDQGITLMIVTK